jgi:hypothetical protein
MLINVEIRFNLDLFKIYFNLEFKQDSERVIYQEGLH